MKTQDGECKDFEVIFHGLVKTALVFTWRDRKNDRMATLFRISAILRDSLREMEGVNITTFRILAF
jgi:hypothetical protein